MAYIVDPRLKQWATATQARYIDAINKTGSQRKAAIQLGIHRRGIQKSLKSVEKKAAAHGYAPEYGLNSEIPEPFIARGHSTLERIDPLTGEREQVLQWTKTRLDEQQWLEAIQEAVQGFVEDVPPLTISQPPRDVQSDIIPWIQIGDAHFGMLAHAAETGQNFDLKIAERELCGAIGMLIDETQPCERMVINDLGDFTHYENYAGETEASGHKLDFDGRFPKMIKVYSRTMRWIIEKALTKAQTVDVIINQGNHSRTNDIWMAELLRVAFPERVNVLDNDNIFIGYRMGNTFVMITHTDKCRGVPNLAGVMTTDFRVDWGETEFHYIDGGHVHHKMSSKEHPGLVYESWNILAAMDKYAHDGGWRSRQCVTRVDRSRTYGEVGRRVLPVQEVWDRLCLKTAAPRRAFAA